MEAGPARELFLAQGGRLATAANSTAQFLEIRIRAHPADRCGRCEIILHTVSVYLSLGRKPAMRPQSSIQPSAPAKAADQFEAWIAERTAIQLALETATKDADADRDRLLNRSFELERRIVETPSAALPAIRAKVEILVWYMQMEQADGLPAMLHIRDYIERKA